MQVVATLGLASIRPSPGSTRKNRTLGSSVEPGGCGPSQPQDHPGDSPWRFDEWRRVPGASGVVPRRPPECVPVPMRHHQARGDQP
ncbi:hypothetical protein DLJ61_15555 [Gordonia terrae]|uniref:Uncharacterized protein n=1 Tax=Gordonia terrae TaxID=2055 RepID=A0AAD0KEN2_9ACTN|nr:hypothetical protein DLJ61_15555 [Gordonia terrae]